MDLCIQDIVLCKIYRKATSLKVLEQRAAMEERMKTDNSVTCSDPPPLQPMSPLISGDTTTTFSSKDQELAVLGVTQPVMKKEDEEEETMLSFLYDEATEINKILESTIVNWYGEFESPVVQSQYLGPLFHTLT